MHVFIRLQRVGRRMALRSVAGCQVPAMCVGVAVEVQRMVWKMLPSHASPLPPVCRTLRSRRRQLPPG
jgi:hypothetical protein